MTNRKLIFYGTLGYPNKKVVGGGEAGNQKTLSVFNELGFTVEKLYKPYLQKSKIGAVIYIFKLALTIPQLGVKILKNRDADFVHVSGFYMHLIYQEYVLIFLAKLLGRKCVYELRGGGVQEAYEKGSSIYRFFFKKAVTKADIILSQGEKYLPFLKELGVKKAFHYPNYINTSIEYIKRVAQQEKNGKMELVYFGRISRTKNIELIIDIARHLRDKGKDYRLELIGKGDEDYIDHVNALIASNHLSGMIRLSPALFGEELFNILGKKHFFIFPSKEPREGHSNALTEAMSLGIIPICSSMGFNREVVGTEYLVIDDYQATWYADRIAEIWESDNWSFYSQQMMDRVQKEFTVKGAKQLLATIYLSN